MAISEVCKYEVKKEMDECVSKGMSRRAAAKWLADTLTENTGREINSETIRKMDQRVRQEVGTNVPKDDWPKCKNCQKSKVKKVWVWSEPDENGCCTSVPTPAKHGLCNTCRQKEIKEQKDERRAKKIKEAQAEFDHTPIDEASNQFWDELSDKILKPLSNGGIPCGKVGEEVSAKIDSWFANLLDSVHEVSRNSNRPTEYT